MWRSIGRWRQSTLKPVAKIRKSSSIGPAFEFQPRAGADCPGLDRIHCLSYPATLSLGVITGDIPAISEGALQLTDRLAALLYAEDIEHHFARMAAYAEPEILGDEWVAEPLPPSSTSSSPR